MQCCTRLQHTTGGFDNHHFNPLHNAFIWGSLIRLNRILRLMEYKQWVHHHPSAAPLQRAFGAD